MEWILMLWMWLFGSPESAQLTDQRPYDAPHNRQEQTPTAIQVGAGSSDRMIVRDVRYLHLQTVVIFEDTHFTKVPQ